MLIRLTAMESAGFDASDALREAEGNYVISDVSRILLMMPERAHRIFKCRCPMRIGGWPNRRIAHRSCIKREQRFFAKPPIVEGSQLHHEIMRMLSVDNRFT